MAFLECGGDLDTALDFLGTIESAVATLFFTGTAGVPPAMSAQREQTARIELFDRSFAPCGAQAGGTPALPVKSLSLMPVLQIRSSWHNFCDKAFSTTFA